MHENQFQSWYEFFGCTFRISFCQKWLTLVRTIQGKMTYLKKNYSSSIFEVCSTLWRICKKMKTKNFTLDFKRIVPRKLQVFIFDNWNLLYEWVVKDACWIWAHNNHSKRSYEFSKLKIEKKFYTYATTPQGQIWNFNILI
jgi:hypothetical protein